MECNCTTWAGTLTDDAGRIHYVSCDLCRSVRIDATDPRRKAWSVTSTTVPAGWPPDWP